LDCRRHFADHHFIRCVTRSAEIAVPVSFQRILPDVALNKSALPNSPAHDAGSRKSFCLPQQAQVSRVSFQAQYRAFVRFAVGSSAAI
jgi:hypothetical protein